MPVADTNVLVLDSHTVRDLEIFGSDTGGTSLFDFCNLARTAGGARVLRRRLERPWAKADRILATQKALSFIISHRDAFDVLPAAYTTGRVEQYTHEILPLVIHKNWLEFGASAFMLWTNEGRHYIRIMNGVHFTCGLINTLKRFVEQAELSAAEGELALLINEMNELLSQDALSKVPEQGTSGSFWRTLRLDQLFRLQEKEVVLRLLQLWYEVDALVSMADVTREQAFILPEIDEGALRVEAEGLRHPYIEDAVANPVALDTERHVLFLTGPNMAGKTTYLRAFAISFYLAHLGMGVPARGFRFVPVQRLFSSISLNDDLHNGVSYFRAEALRVKAIAEAMKEGHTVVALLDEPFKGTNVKDALDASLAILERLATKPACLIMFSSHLIELTEALSGNEQIDCRYFQADEGEGRLRFDYQLHQGISTQRLGMRVLREEGIFELLDAPDSSTD